MVKRPILLAVITIIFIALIGYLLRINWKEETYNPLQATVTQVLATRTGYTYATATQSAEYHQMTATAQQATRDVQQTQTRVSWERTATAIPTTTPTRGPSCLARVSNKSAYLYSDPGINPNPNLQTSLPYQQEVHIVGRMHDTAWVQVEFEGIRGFTQNNNLKKVNEGCEPQLLAIHHMAGYLDDNPDWHLVLEDTFATDSNLWYAIDGKQINADSSAPEAILEVTNFLALTEFSTDKIKSKEFEAFELIFNARINRPNIHGYFGIRFFQTEDGRYNELRFNPSSCIFTIYEEDTKLFDVNFDQSLCLRKDYFQVRIKVDESKNLHITVNGETKGPTEIVNVNKREMSGPISLIVNELKVTYNYLVVTAPKE